jgi:hypothetical protein
MACGGGAVAPASTGPSGGAVGWGEHQCGRPVSTRVEARPRAAQGQPVACDGSGRGGMAGNARGNSTNTRNEEEHELHRITYRRFEWSLKKNGGRK